jgi:hypothetical protein
MVTDRRTRQDFAACMRDLVHTYVRHYDRFGGSTGWPMHDLALPDFKPRQSTDALA